MWYQWMGRTSSLARRVLVGGLQGREREILVMSTSPRFWHTRERGVTLTEPGSFRWR